MTNKNGWTLYSHQCFSEKYNQLTQAVGLERAKQQFSDVKSSNEKLRDAIRDLIYNKIPQDPTNKIYRQGKTLGLKHKHWFRAKFGNGRFRLFFRFNTETKIIIYAWVNDEATLRTYGSKTDAYVVFEKMLNSGNPPDDWATLLASSQSVLLNKE